MATPPDSIDVRMSFWVVPLVSAAEAWMCSGAAGGEAAWARAERLVKRFGLYFRLRPYGPWKRL